MTSEEYYKNIISKLISHAKNKGANVKIAIANEKRFDVNVRNGIVEELQEATSASLSMLVYLNNKVASAISSDMSITTLETLLDSTIERAKLSSEDESAIFPEYKPLKTNIQSLGMYDEEINCLSATEKINIAKELETICLKDKRIDISAGAGYSTIEIEHTLGLSNGFLESYKKSSCSCGVYLQAGDSQDGWYDYAHSPKQLISVEDIANQAIFRTIRMLGARKIPTQICPIIVDRYAAGSIFGFFLECINGRNVFMKQSIFSEMLDKKIAVPITLYDNPLIPNAPASSPFDAEGTPTQYNNIIENGILKNYILNTYSAKKLNLQTNGLASGVTNLILTPQKHSVSELIKSIDKGLLLLKTIGQGTDTTTGDFSKGAYGMWIEKGEIAFPVNEITISGNIKEMLSGIVVANNPDERKKLQIPTFRIEEMTIGGE